MDFAAGLWVYTKNLCPPKILGCRHGLLHGLIQSRVPWSFKCLWCEHALRSHMKAYKDSNFILGWSVGINVGWFGERWGHIWEKARLVLGTKHEKF